MGIGLDIDLRGLQTGLAAQLTALQTQLIPKATKIALARMGRTVRKEAGVEIRKQLKIKAADAKEAITLQIRDGYIVISFSQKPISLRKFGARQAKTGVSYQIAPAGGRKIYRNKYGGSFIVQRLNGQVFVRSTSNPAGPRKAKITKLTGPSVAVAFGRESVKQRLNALAQERFRLEFQRAIGQLTR